MKRSPIRKGKPMARKPIRTAGRVSAARQAVRKEWIEKHPPEYGYWQCHICIYFNEPWGITLIPEDKMALDHIEAKGHLTFEESNKDSNLAPAHWICNSEKGSQALDQMKHSPISHLPNPHHGIVRS